MKLTMRESVLNHLTSEPYTASHLAKVLNLKLSSLSSILKKMIDDQELQRVDNIGPRGGYGYCLLSTVRKP
jgi:predicted transcriptional regulator